VEDEEGKNIVQRDMTDFVVIGFEDGAKEWRQPL
jgi:hypothetical protein